MAVVRTSIVGNQRNHAVRAAADRNRPTPPYKINSLQGKVIRVSRQFEDGRSWDITRMI